MKNNEKIYKLPVKGKNLVTLTKKIMRELEIIPNTSCGHMYIEGEDAYIHIINQEDIKELPYVGKLFAIKKMSQIIHINELVVDLFNIKRNDVLNCHIEYERIQNTIARKPRYEAREYSIFSKTKKNSIQLPYYFLDWLGIDFETDEDLLFEIHLEFGRIVIQPFEKSGKTGNLESFIKGKGAIVLPSEYIELLNFKRGDTVKVGICKNKFIVEK